MIDVSQEWKEAFGNIISDDRKRLLPETFVELECEFNDSVAQTNAVATSSNATSWSTTNQVTNTEVLFSHKIATLEANMWILDGSRQTLPATTFNAGYVSQNVSWPAYIFTPEITITWSSLQTSLGKGITVTFDPLLEEYATRFTIVFYNGSTVVKQIEVPDNNSPVCEIGDQYVNYNKMVLKVVDWVVAYGHRARIQEIMLGTKEVFSKKNLMGYTHTQSVDLLSLKLPQNQIEFSLSNINQEWNPDNPNGKYQKLLTRQKINVKYGIKLSGGVEYHKIGTFYMSDWTTPQNGITATFTAEGLMQFMSGTFNPTGTGMSGYTFGQSVPVTQLINAAFLQSNLPVNADGSNKWQILNDIGYGMNVVIPYKTESGVNKWDFDFTCAEVVQLCVNASNGIIQYDIEGNVILKRFNPFMTDYYIDEFVGYQYGEYSISQKLKNFNINNTYNIVVDGSGDVEQSITNPLIQSSGNAESVANQMTTVLSLRKSIDGEYRCDPRLNTYDKIQVQNQFATNHVLITDVVYNYNGAFTGTYEGKIEVSIPKKAADDSYYVGDVICGGAYG